MSVSVTVKVTVQEIINAIRANGGYQIKFQYTDEKGGHCAMGVARKNLNGWLDFHIPIGTVKLEGPHSGTYDGGYDETDTLNKYIAHMNDCMGLSFSEIADRLDLLPEDARNSTTEILTGNPLI